MISISLLITVCVLFIAVCVPVIVICLFRVFRPTTRGEIFKGWARNHPQEFMAIVQRYRGGGLVILDEQILDVLDSNEKVNKLVMEAKGK